MHIIYLKRKKQKKCYKHSKPFCLIHCGRCPTLKSVTFLFIFSVAPFFVIYMFHMLCYSFFKIVFCFINIFFLTIVFPTKYHVA